jgi:hypothetical protein
MSIEDYFILYLTKMDKIKIIMSQTNYSEDLSAELLEQYNGDHMKIIRDYLGIKEPEQQTIKSVNQEIYKLIRKQIDISHYNTKINEQIEKFE